MDWKFTNDRPVYLQIKDQLRGAVLSGEFAPGTKIPSVRDIATEAKVNPNTMQHALHELEQEGLLMPHGTNGRFVTEDPSVLEEVRSRCLTQLALECMHKFSLLGVSPQEIVSLIEQLGKERTECEWTPPL